jgi:predicted ABC-type ATPase
MKKKGYEIILFFLCTSILEININRVKKRVAEGGHDVPESIIIHPYGMSLTYLKGNLQIFHKVYLIDNSEKTALLMAELNAGVLNHKEPNAPKWVGDVLYIIERLKNKT